MIKVNLNFLENISLSFHLYTSNNGYCENKNHWIFFYTYNNSLEGHLSSIADPITFFLFFWQGQAYKHFWASRSLLLGVVHIWYWVYFNFCRNIQLAPMNINISIILLIFFNNIRYGSRSPILSFLTAPHYLLQVSKKLDFWCMYMHSCTHSTGPLRNSG